MPSLALPNALLLAADATPPPPPPADAVDASASWESLGFEPVNPDWYMKLVTYGSLVLLVGILLVNWLGRAFIGYKGSRGKKPESRDFCIPTKYANKLQRYGKVFPLGLALAIQIVSYIYWVPIFGIHLTTGEVATAVAIIVTLIPLCMLALMLLFDVLNM